MSIDSINSSNPVPHPEPGGPRADSGARSILASAIACRHSAKRALQILRPPAPAADKLLIRAAAQSGPGGLPRMIDYHSAQFGAGQDRALVALRHVEGDIAGNHAAIAEMEFHKCRRLRETDPYIDVPAPGAPWTWGARLGVLFLVLFSLAMALVGLNTIAVVLQNSGLTGFESPARAFLFSLVSIGVAVGLKFIPRFISSDVARRRYGITIWLTGVFLGGAWACLFSRTFPGMTQSASEILAGALSGSEAAPAPNSGWWLIFCGLLAEAFIAAGCWLTVEIIASRYTGRRRVPNQAHLRILADLKCLARAKHEVGYYLGAVRGQIEEIEQARRALLAQVTELFGLAVIACEHQREAFRLFQQ